MRNHYLYLHATIFILVGVLVWVLSSADVATADIYTESAHGDPSNGVNRSGTGYPIGGCTHCHDTFIKNPHSYSAQA